MTIVKDIKYNRRLYQIMAYIAQDKKSAVIKFEKALNKQINNLTQFPYKYRKSYYFDDNRYRDMVFKGYTVIYKVEPGTIKILDIFKWQER